MGKMSVTEPTLDLSPGMKIRLQELQNLDSRAAWTTLTQDEKTNLVKALEKHRERKATGLRSRGLAEMADVRHTIKRLENEVHKLPLLLMPHVLFKYLMTL